MLGFTAKKRAEPLYCRWLWHAVTVLCDGSVTCGPDDPFKVRNYGSVAEAPLSEHDPGEHRSRRASRSASIGDPLHGMLDV